MQIFLWYYIQLEFLKTHFKQLIHKIVKVIFQNTWYEQVFDLFTTAHTKYMMCTALA